jgi:hypothetical protein
MRRFWCVRTQPLTKRVGPSLTSLQTEISFNATSISTFRYHFGTKSYSSQTNNFWPKYRPEIFCFSNPNLFSARCKGWWQEVNLITLEWWSSTLRVAIYRSLRALGLKVSLNGIGRISLSKSNTRITRKLCTGSSTCSEAQRKSKIGKN